jgi:DNA ligase-1
MTHAPQLATDYYGQPIKGWLLSEKLDGIYADWTGSELRTKTGKLILCPTSITDSLPAFPLAGELWAGRGGFQRVLSALKSGISGDWASIEFVAFDAPGSLARASTRMEITQSIPSVKAVSQTVITDKRHMKRLVKEILATGGEGAILRNPASLYTAGRSDDYAKVKPVLCDEATYTGKTVTTATGKTSLICEYQGETFKLHTNTPATKGQLVTFEYYGLTDSGKPRHAQFIAIRDYE